MDLELKIENFGPIDEATIQVGQFTVFAGPNNTGKTFVAKMLYSILSARNTNHARVFFDTMADIIESNLQFSEQSGRVSRRTSPCPQLEGDSKRSTLSYGRRSQVIRSKMNLIDSGRSNQN